jgi:hypothetical protein
MQIAKQWLQELHVLERHLQSRHLIKVFSSLLIWGQIWEKKFQFTQILIYEAFSLFRKATPVNVEKSAVNLKTLISLLITFPA